jgi:glycosyltransferase involved in cell wall biosynthesis
MKILFFANTSWNLYNFRLHLIETLVSEGHDVHLLSPGDEFTHFLTDAGLQWDHFPISRKGMNLFNEIRTIRELKRVFTHLRPEIVFNFTPKCVLYGSVVARVLRIPEVVNTISGLGYLFSGPKMRLPIIREVVRVFYRFALSGSKVIFQNPEDMKEFVSRKIIKKSQAYMVRGSGVDINKFVPTDEMSGVPIVVLPSRLIKEKGAFEFVQAARMLKERNVSARFVLVGQIDYENPSAISEKQIISWVEEGVVEWWGWRSDMVSIYQSSKIVCLPTYYREGTPKTLIEAAACGRAIIASNIPGCREIVRNNQNGILIKPSNVKQLADAIQALLEDNQLRMQMGLTGRQFVENEFHNKLITSEIKQVAGLHP